MDLEVSKLKFNQEVEYLSGVGKAALESRGWRLRHSLYPTLDLVIPHPKSGREIGFRFQCDFWDEQPPSLTLFDTKNPDRLLPLDEWPRGWSENNHPQLGKPFLCLPGIREYYLHESHRNERWDDLRSMESYKLRFIIERVYKKLGSSNG